MKTRERISHIRKAHGFSAKIRLAADDFPGTPFDGLFRDMAEAWSTDHREDRDALRKVRCPLARKWVTQGNPQITAEEAGEIEKFYTGVGRALTDAVVRGESGFIRELADSVDKWVAHRPDPDSLRHALLMIAPPQLGAFTMRHVLSRLPRYGIRIEESTPRVVRRVAKELGIRLEGKAGRPKPKPDL